MKLLQKSTRNAIITKKENQFSTCYTYSKNLNISACLFSLFLHNFISTLTLFQSTGRCRAGSQPICTKYCPKCHVFMIIYWFFELGIYFFWHFVLIFSTTWSQQLFWILIQNDWKLLQKFCIKFQIFWIYIYKRESSNAKYLHWNTIRNIKLVSTIILNADTKILH